MSQLLIQEAGIIHQAIYSQGTRNFNRIQQFRLFLRCFSGTLEGFWQQLCHLQKQYDQKVRADVEQNYSVIFLNGYLCETIRQLTAVLGEILDNTKNHILVSVQGFASKYKLTNQSLCQNSLQLFAQLESNAKSINEIRRMQSSEVQQQQFQNGQMVFTNNLWAELQQKYKKVLQEFDFSNQTRCIFIKNMEIQFIRNLSKIIPNHRKVNQDLLQYEKFQYVHKALQQFIITSIEEKLGRSQLLCTRTFPLISHFPQNMYANQKNSINSIDNQNTSTNTIPSPSSSAYTTQRQQIQSYTLYFITKSRVFQQFEGTRNLILQNLQWGGLFLESLCSRLYTSIDLSLQKYNQITTMIKFLFVTLSHLQQIQQPLIYNLLYVGIRINYKDKLLIKQLSKYEEYWINEDLWKKIHGFIKGKIDRRKNSKKKIQKNIKVQNQELKHESPLSHNKNGAKQSNAVNSNYNQGSHSSNGMNYYTKNENFFNRSLKKLGLIKQIKQFRSQDEQVDYVALRQINIYLSKLELKSQLIVKLVIGLCKLYRISKHNIQKLILYHYYNRKNDLNKLCANTKMYQFITPNQNKLIYCIKLCLLYLPVQQSLCRLKLVNRLWNKQLKQPIYQRYLKYQANLNVLAKLRISIYHQIIPQAYDEKIYSKMLKQAPESTQYTDLIRMDVKRSLSWQLSSQPDLYDLLVLFSFYNQKIGYLQGMNYIAEHIYKLNDIKQPYRYSIFDYVMTTYFQNLFKNNFEQLKLRLYQFNRLMQINLPQLHKHFQNQKVQGQHFLVAWAVTLWGQLKGDLVWILWDGFILDGWRWWIKVGIWVLGVFEAQFLQMRFEQLLKFFSDLGSNEFFNCKFNDFFAFGIQPLKIKEQINRIKVTDKILKLLQKEFTYSKKKYQQLIKQ